MECEPAGVREREPAGMSIWSELKRCWSEISSAGAAWSGLDLSALALHPAAGAMPALRHCVPYLPALLAVLKHCLPVLLHWACSTYYPAVSF